MSTNFDPNRPISVALHENQRAISNNAKSLKRAAQDMIHQMERLIRNIDEGYTINTLGEVQGRGSEVDRLCAIRGTLFDFRNTLQYVAEKGE
jgi:hypothetical protein